jgi:lipoic acid synthetase
MTKKNIERKPRWMKSPLPKGKTYIQMKDVVSRNKLHTICTSGNCPNMGECWNAGTATFMILGDICTRSCKFCDVKTGRPLPVDAGEPVRVADAVEKMKIKHCVLTSVDRDDLPDGGAAHWAATIREIKRRMPFVTIEALIPDFDAKEELIMMVVDAGAEVISHNLETVRRLTPSTRSRAKYDRSLEVLRIIAASKARAKSGIMLGIGEREDEILETMDDMIAAGVEVMTIGQYLRPSPKHLPVLEYIHPDKFKEYERIGLEKGFRFVESGPLVRSSYHAEKHVR